LLEEFTEQQPGGRQFVNLVRRQDMQLKFCATSALGHSPDEHRDKLVERATRYRVLDPLFWTLCEGKGAPLFQSLWGGKDNDEDGLRSQQRLLLVLDSSQGANAVYGDGRPAAFWDAMCDRGEIVTHYLGRLRPVGYAGQRPPTGPSQRPHLRLLGPILDRSPTDSRVLVLSEGEILDLADFRSSSWRDRVLIGVANEDQEDTWPHTFVVREDEDCEAIVRRLLRLKEETY
jgi:hypothetical protein